MLWPAPKSSFAAFISGRKASSRESTTFRQLREHDIRRKGTYSPNRKAQKTSASSQLALGLPSNCPLFSFARPEGYALPVPWRNTVVYRFSVYGCGA
jgi:hypothetical protein